MTVIAVNTEHNGDMRTTTSKQAARGVDSHNGHTEENPVIAGCEYVYENTDLVRVDEDGVEAAAEYIHRKMLSESYSPRTWRTHPLHIIPDDTKSLHDPANVRVLDWIFLISSLNFSFWSEREGTDARYGVLWQESWTSGKPKVFTGYWSLVAALNRALSEGIPITDPKLYADANACSNELIAHVFRRAPQSEEDIPLLQERISIMHENGRILCENFGGSFAGFIDAFNTRHAGQGTALDLVKMVTKTFPSFRDETVFEGRRVCIWKRAQILVAELWAAFFPDASPESTAAASVESSASPPSTLSAEPTSSATSGPASDFSAHTQTSTSLSTSTFPTPSTPASSTTPALLSPTTTSPTTSTTSPSASTPTTSTPTSTSASTSPPHPLFPGPRGPAIGALTMFADYRVPQVLHHLRILRYSPPLATKLRGALSSEEKVRRESMLASGSQEEVALRAGSVLAVERVREAIGRRVREAIGRRGREAGERRVREPIEHRTKPDGYKLEVSSVLIDFYLWDLAKRVESGAERIEGIETAEVLPAHRTRSIWY